jgi:PEP-CTERM motif-containing protein
MEKYGPRRRRPVLLLPISHVPYSLWYKPSAGAIGFVTSLCSHTRHLHERNQMRPSLFCTRVALAFILTSVTAHSSLAITYTNIDYPGANNTQATGIEGNSIVGTYYNDLSPASVHGFLYNGTTYTTLDAPLATAGTYPRSISGGKIAGSYNDAAGSHGFLYNGATYTTFDNPLAVPNQLGENGTYPTGIDGNNIVGYYGDSFGKRHGFLYNGSSFTPLAFPAALETSPSAIDGTNVVGWYLDSSSAFHGFLYDGTTYTTLDDPNALRTFAYGIDGNNIVGGYNVSLNGGSHGFLYNGTTYTTLDDLSAKPEGTYAAMGIDGSRIVGTYYDASNNLHGFLATVPEPATFTLAMFAAAGICLKGRRRA